MKKIILLISYTIFVIIVIPSCNWFTAPKNNPPPIEDSKLKLLWEIPYNMVGTEIIATPLLIGDSVVIMSAGKEIYSIYKTTGKIKWKYFVSDLTNIQTREFLTDGKRIYMSHVEDIRAINLSNGTEVWKTPMTNERGNFWTRDKIINNNKLFVVGLKTIYCINVDNGNILWSQNPSSGQYGSPVYFNNKVITTSAQAIIDSKGNDIGTKGIIHWLDADNGDTLFSKPIQGGGHFQNLSIDKTGIFYGGTYFTYGIGASFEAINAETGERIWSYYTPNQAWSYEDCTIAGDKVFVNITLYGTAAFDKNTGALLWRKTYFSYADFTHKKPILYNGYLYVIHGSKLYIINPDTGDKIYSYEPSDNPFGTFTVGNGKIFICGYNKLQCYEEYKPK